MLIIQQSSMLVMVVVVIADVDCGGDDCWSFRVDHEIDTLWIVQLKIPKIL